MTVEVQWLQTTEQVEAAIAEAIADSGHPDLRSLAEAWHLNDDWDAQWKLTGINFLLHGLGHPEIPTCCSGVDHNRDDAAPLLPGDPAGPPNYPAAPKKTPPTPGGDQ